MPHVTTHTTPHVLVRPAILSDRPRLAHLRAALWTDSSPEEQAQELLPLLEDRTPQRMPLTHLVAETPNHLVIGFLEIGLRSHADGCDPERPVAYIEGWYVEENHRHQGVGRKLLAAAEDWARSQGCHEVASDALIDNSLSQSAHQALGFAVVDRCVHYRKPL